MTKQQLKGLSAKEVLESRAKYGENILTPPAKASLWSQFIEKFKDPLITILLVALLLSISISCYEVFILKYDLAVFLEPLGIGVAILLATVVGFAVEVNANKKFDLLNLVNDDINIKVIRDGNITQVPRKDIVVGDIVILETGDEVPADGELLDSVSLSVNESSLTGEPIAKKSHIAPEVVKETTYPYNHVLRGSTISEGHCAMEVFAVGDSTEYGKVYEEAQFEDDKKTPLTIQFDKLGKVISYGSYFAASLIFIGRLLIYDYQSPIFTADLISYLMTTIMLAVTLIVVSVPEGLPMSVTLSLALSMRRMLQANNLVRKMHACETMGATNIICTDKTGTLTQNMMKVYRTHFFGIDKEQKLNDNDSSKIIEESIACNSTAFIDNSSDQIHTLGNPTEGALLLWLHGQNIDYLNIRNSVETEYQLPFSTINKYMATIVNNNGKRMLYVKGAPEIVMNMCNNIISDINRDEITTQLSEYQEKAMRTLAFAYKELDSNENPIADNSIKTNNLSFLGFVAISDPIREEVPQAIKECQDAGIQVKIVTGDTVRTACEIGRQVGLWNNDDTVENNHISGPDFAALSDDEATQRLHNIKVISRARPSDKSRLVNLLQNDGNVVAVTGDGTNDAPALNAAQVGLSMGYGTSVAKEASDITIIDNSFASISKAVMWGRSLYKNIQRFILFQVTVNVVACAIVGLGAFMSYQSPLTVTQMLWVNLIMDTFAALSFASLPASREVMRSKPRTNDDFIITKGMWEYIACVGGLFIIALFGLLQYFKNSGIESMADFSFAQYFRSFIDFHYTKDDIMTPKECTLFFTIFVFMQFWSMFNVKSFATPYSFFHDLKHCKVFLSTVLVILFGQILIVEIGGQMFNVVSIDVMDWVYIIAGTSVIFWIGEIFNIIINHKNQKRQAE